MSAAESAGRAAARRWVCSSEAETRRVGRVLAAELRSGGVLLLRADLGLGKTVLTKGVAEALGIDPERVQSPTFTLVHQYGGEVELVHVDLYRVEPAEVEALGLEELMGGDAVVVVEWAERLPFHVPDALWVEMRLIDRGQREIVVHERQGEDG